MKLLISLVLPVILLQLDTAYSISKTYHDAGCTVKDAQKFSLLGDTSLNLTFFITPENPITIQVFFDGRKNYEDNDFLKLNPFNGTICRERDGYSTTKDIILENDIPIGWNIMTITLQDRKLHIGNFYTLAEFEYPVDGISFTAKYLTDCANGTPRWKIDISEGVDIPVNGLTKFGIELVSDQLFHPGIALNSIDIPLSYDNEVIVRKSSVLLPPREYKMVVEYFGSMVSLFSKSKNDELHLLMKFAIKEDLIYLKMKSIEGAFSVVFDPFPDEHDEEEVMESTRSPEIQDIQVTTKSSESSFPQCPDNSSSCTVWQISTCFASVIAVILSIYSVFLSRTNYTKQKLKELDMEGGEESMPLLLQDSLKYGIKATSTETLTEPNIQREPYKKEICKIKLISDSKYPNKKVLGQLDSHKPIKVILVVGQTASGKSSFINAIVNHMYGVTYNDTFRFKLIDEIYESYMSGNNSTENITSYYIPFSPGMKHNCNFIFIDTPGFGDIRGISEDKKWNNKFKEFLQNNPDISQVDGICFLIKVTDTRLTYSQTYIIDGLFSMFGNDVKNNIFAIVSHSDGSESHAPELLQESGLDYRLSINFNSVGLYNDKKMASESPKEIENYFMKNWDMSMKSIEGFFEVLVNTPAVSLSLTNIVLEENKDIESLKDELLELMTIENHSTDKERENIQSRIEQNQELLMMKLDEAGKLSGRLENIPAKKNPLVINEYIERLIKSEKNEDKILELKNLKDRNTSFQKIMKEKKSTKSLVNMILGEKTEKTE